MAPIKLFTKVELDRYEKFLTDRPDEKHAAEFFATHPRFLLLGNGKDLRREVVMIPTGWRKPIYRVDFFRREFGRRDFDIVELKSPSARLCSGSPSHQREAAMVVKALRQAQDYRELIIADSGVRSQLAAKGILVFRPRILIVIGQDDPNWSQDAMALVFDRIRERGVDIMSYSDIARFAQDHYQATRTFVIPAGTASSDVENQAWLLYLQLYNVALQALPKRDQYIMHSKEADGRASQEIALEFGLSERSVRRIIAASRSKIYSDMEAKIERFRSDA